MNWRERRAAPWQIALRRNKWLGTAILIVALAALQWLQQHNSNRGTGPVPAGGEISGNPRLVDGDSFYLNGDEVRLVGLDAPEGRQTCSRNGVSWPCGEESRRFLASLIAGRAVVCRSKERDQHGRLLAVCSVDGRDLNREMVASGMAVAYGNYENDESAARSARRGLWAGDFDRPRDWRRQHGRGRD